MLEGILKRALQTVFGGGANINAGNPLQTYDPKIGSLISYDGETTSDGAGDGSTLIDSVLTTKPDFDGNLVIITSGALEGQARAINGITTGGTVTPTSVFGGQIVSGVTFTIVGIRTTPTAVAAILTLIGAATNDGDLSTLFAKLKQQFIGTHAHVLLVVNNASALDADLDTALKDELEDQGYTVVVADPADVAGSLELSFDFIVVSGSVVADTNLTLLREADCPVICHSAEVAISTDVFSLGVTAGAEINQTQIEIVDNTVEWMIGQATGDLTVTASATIETMASVSGATISVAEEATGTGNEITLAVLRQGTADGSGVIHSFDRYFIGVKDFTNANAVFKAIIADLWIHMVQEVRFGEITVTPKRVYQEQIPDTDVSDTATVTEADCVLLEKGPTQNRRFCLRDFRLKAQADPTGDTITVRLYTCFEGTLTEVDSFPIDTSNWGTYHSLMDMFGVPGVHSDAIKITCQMDAGTVAVKATYAPAEARK